MHMALRVYALRVTMRRVSRAPLVVTLGPYSISAPPVLYVLFDLYISTFLFCFYLYSYMYVSAQREHRPTAAACPLLDLLLTVVPAEAAATCLAAVAARTVACSL